MATSAYTVPSANFHHQPGRYPAESLKDEVGVLPNPNAVGTIALAPMNQAAQQVGVPMFHYIKTASDAGPVTVTMPDMEVLDGSWQVISTTTSTVRLNSQGAVVGTAVTPSSMGSFFASAVGPRTTLTCHGVTAAGHGGGICQTPAGAMYQAR
jgi:hypothetical protein